jgi:hypothetical protein
MAEKRDPALAALLNTIDLERRMEPVVLAEHADVHDPMERTGTIRGEYDDDGVLLVGIGWPAGDEEV